MTRLRDRLSNLLVPADSYQRDQDRTARERHAALADAAMRSALQAAYDRGEHIAAVDIAQGNVGSTPSEVFARAAVEEAREDRRLEKEAERRRAQRQARDEAMVLTGQWTPRTPLETARLAFAQMELAERGLPTTPQAVLEADAAATRADVDQVQHRTGALARAASEAGRDLGALARRQTSCEQIVGGLLGERQPSERSGYGGPVSYR